MPTCKLFGTMTKQEANRMACTRAKILAAVFAAISALLIVGSFFVPPIGFIDPSVMAAVGELIAWGALFMAWEAIDRGIDAKWTHGDNTLELNNPDNKDADTRAGA